MPISSSSPLCFLGRQPPPAPGRGCQDDIVVEIYLHYLVHGLDAAQGDVLLPQQLVASLLAGRRVQLQREAEGGDEEAARVARGHPTHPVREHKNNPGRA